MVKITIGEREISFELRKKPQNDKAPLQNWASEKKFNEFMQSERERTGKSDAEILEELFHDGWLTVMVGESGSAKINASQLWKESSKKEDKTEEYARLRENFAPISSCVDYLKDQILAGGIGVVIKDSTNKLQKEFKEDIEKLIDNIYQDIYMRGLEIIMPILVDKALTDGCSAAEITYKGEKTFWDYATVAEESKTVKIKGKDTEIVFYETTEPKWKDDLSGITRLKLFDNAHKRFQVQRDPKTWEIKYWILDEGKDAKPIKLSSGLIVRQLLRGSKVAGTYFHPWQIFWLTLRRKNYSVKGESVIKPVYGTAILLEKILKAVGDGIYRAGNKKYFIVCGSKERPWSSPHIRNVLQQLKEASKKNWSTIPMPEGFSVEEIGGEVFEAKDVVDYFKKTIASAMKVPAEVLGVEVKEQKKYSYKEYKLNLMSALKHQLYKRHIWCLHGVTRTKQGGKGKEASYIPDPRFKTEDLLSMREKFDLFIGSLNAANPIHPLLKLKVENEFAEMMGWDDVLLPTQEEFKAELKKAQEEEEKRLKAKAQGPPKPQTKERQEKRLEGMTKKHEEKGKSRELGGTRVPREVQESLASPVADINLNITVEGKPIKIDPIKIKTEEQNINVIIKDDEEKSKLEKEKLEAEKKLAEERLSGEEDKRSIIRKIEKQAVDNEAEANAKLGAIKAKTLVEIDESKKTEEVRREEIKKTAKAEREELKKTEEKKRKAIDKIEREIE